MLGQRRRRWPNIKTALCQRAVFAGKGVPPPPPRSIAPGAIHAARGPRPVSQQMVRVDQLGGSACTRYLWVCSPLVLAFWQALQVYHERVSLPLRRPRRLSPCFPRRSGSPCLLHLLSGRLLRRQGWAWLTRSQTPRILSICPRSSPRCCWRLLRWLCHYFLDTIIQRDTGLTTTVVQ